VQSGEFEYHPHEALNVLSEYFGQFEFQVSRIRSFLFFFNLRKPLFLKEGLSKISLLALVLKQCFKTSLREI
jgi:hypothetical protein